jgi:tagatose-6-phosphate ketose/aldose isomerase
MPADSLWTVRRMDAVRTPGAITRAEIFQQPDLWLTTVARAREFDPSRISTAGPFVVTGAGTSAHAATAVAGGWPGARAVPTTDLLVDHKAQFPPARALLSLARSGDSPESVGVVKKIQRHYPDAKQFAITCNSEGRLAHQPGIETLLLDPRTNDRSLVMTSSFSNLVLGGLCVHHLADIESAVADISNRAKTTLVELDEQALAVASRQFSRAVILASSPLIGVAREASLKLLEMTSGQVAALSETFLGLRHGPLSFVRADTLVLCLLSSSPETRRYELDLLNELRAKGLGYIVAVTDQSPDDVPVDLHVKSMAPNLHDSLRAPFEILFPQLLGLHLSLAAGLDPDNPSPGGVINRVVQGVRIYE